MNARCTTVMVLLALLPAMTVFAAGQSEVPTEETVNLIWYQIGDHGPDADEVNEYLNEYLIENHNLSVDIIAVGFGDYRDKLNVVINAGEYYDIAFTASWREFYPNARKGAYLDITDKVIEYSPDLYKFIPKFVWDGSKVDGANYCVPAYKDIICAHFWLLNKPIVEKYDLDVDNLDGTLEGFEPMFRILKTAVDNGEEPNLLIYGLPQSGHRTIPEEYSLPAGGNVPLGFDVLNDTGKIVNPYENSRTIDVLKTLHKYYKAGYIPAEAPTTQRWEEGFVQFIEEPQGYPGMNTSDQIQIARQSPWTSTEWMTGSAQAISVGSKYPEAALKFLQAVNLDEFVHNTIVYGIEGKHYKKVGETHIEKDWTARDYSMGAWTVGTFFQTLWTVNDEPHDKWDIVFEYVKNTRPLKANGFLYNPENVQNEIAAVANAYAKYQALLLTGAANPEEMVPKMLDELRRAGIEDIRKDIQRQFDTWLESK